MQISRADILYEDNHLLVVNKPVGLATMGVESGTPSLLSAAKAYIKRKYNKPGNVYLGVVSRLDRLASGVIVLARTSKAAARLTRQFSEGTVEKTYWTIVSPAPTLDAGALQDWLVKDESQQRMIVMRSPTAQTKEARLEFEVIKHHAPYAWLAIQLLTGRKHQIRVQLSHHDFPVVGDKKYGSTLPFPTGIALHAHELTITHPVRDETLHFQAALPAAWSQFAANHSWAMKERT